MKSFLLIVENHIAKKNWLLWISRKIIYCRKEICSFHFISYRFNSKHRKFYFSLLFNRDIYKLSSFGIKFSLFHQKSTNSQSFLFESTNEFLFSIKRDQINLFFQDFFRILTKLESLLLSLNIITHYNASQRMKNTLFSLWRLSL